MSQLQVFQCPACGSNLSYNGGPETTITCEYCRAAIRVPEEFRSHAAPTPQPANSEPYTPVAPLGGAVLTGPALLVAVAGWLLNQASAQTGMEIDKDPMASARIAQAADKAMHALKNQEVTPISLPFLTADSNGPKNFEIQLTRAIVDDLASRASSLPISPPAKRKRLFGF